MLRIARGVAPAVPHHVTQLGTRRQQMLFCDEDYEAYLEEMAQWCPHCGVEVWAYCLMPNDVHLVAVPPAEQSLALAIGKAHQRYTRRVNWGQGWRGHLWQGRFASFRRHERTGRPLGGEGFLARLETALGRDLRSRRRGPRGPRERKGTSRSGGDPDQVGCPLN